MNLENILNIISIAAGIAKSIGVPGVSIGANVAAALVAIAQAANKAHIEATGQPIDLDKLQPIAPVE